MADDIFVSITSTYAAKDGLKKADGNAQVSIYTDGFKGTVDFTFYGEATPPDLDPTVSPAKTSVYLDEDDDQDHPQTFGVSVDGDAGDVTVTVEAQAFGGGPSDSAATTITLA
ncbi:hypothetical protein CA54_59340 [Symmachiella macrocystis]|uniref:Uncharacterized protein n=2 Tax=Symmachiella macrocystis TaxID=2527985 RepID=A0A5C6B1Y1_9PLAN|nr:hypothetical protein CA54_59340 [Symmachiella macrocystis]